MLWIGVKCSQFSSETEREKRGKKERGIKGKYVGSLLISRGKPSKYWQQIVAQ